MKRWLMILFIIFILALMGYIDRSQIKKLDSAEWTTWGEFEMEGKNNTPPRIVSKNKYQFIEIQADYSADKPVLFLLEAYSGFNEVIPAAEVKPAQKSGVAKVKLPVTKGLEIQILTQVWMEDGIYDENYPCDIKLSYRLVDY